MRKESAVHRSLFGYFICLLAVCLLWGCAADLDSEPVGTEDSVLAVRVKAALIRSLELNAAAIDVEAAKNGIRLRGFVENEAQKATAGRLAGRVDGVRNVLNDIQIK